MVMECTRRSIVILAFCLVLSMSMVQGTSQDKKVTYLLGRPAENCTSACASRGMPCVDVGGFPSNVLHIFQSLNITCTTSKGTDGYFYKDHPNYCIAGGWKGRCMGFKIPNASWHVTLCGIGHNNYVRRLCPCEKQISTTDAPTTASSPPTTTIPSSSAKTTLSTPIILGTRARDRKQHTSDKPTELSTWLIAVIVVAVVLIICVLLLMLVLIRKRRQRNNNSPPKIRSAPEQRRKNPLDGSDNIVYMESMVNINKLSLSSPTDNVLYESSGNPHAPECELNELYTSCEDENQTMQTSNPIYEESEADEHRHEQRLGAGNKAGDFAEEYASIDQIKL